MRDRRIVWVVFLFVLLAVLAVVYFFVDPMEVRWMPRCVWKVATGTDCPGCGAQRMAHALMHGDMRAAWHANAFALCMLPVIAGLLWLEFSRERYPRLYRCVHSPVVIWCLAASVFGWWVLRNLI